MKNKTAVCFLLVCGVLLGSAPGCSSASPRQEISTTSTPLYTYQIVQTYPHDTQCYTQGLFFYDGYLYESGGLYGESTLRKTAITSGEVLQTRSLPEDIFAEGIVRLQQKILLLSWNEHTAWVYDLQNFEPLQRFSYPTQGWGITFDGSDYLMSDGSSTLYKRDTATFAEKGRIYVTCEQQPVTALNELEYIEGEIWANVYQTDKIVRIDPATGNVTGIIHCDGLLDRSDKKADTDVLNGIAYDSSTRRLFITGKKWPKLFEIKIIEQEL